MSPAQTSNRLRDLAASLRLQHKHVIAAELAVRGLDPARAEIVMPDQVEAVSELLQHIAQRLDETAAGLICQAHREDGEQADVA